MRLARPVFLPPPLVPGGLIAPLAGAARARPVVSGAFLFACGAALAHPEQAGQVGVAYAAFLALALLALARGARRGLALVFIAAFLLSALPRHDAATSLRRHADGRARPALVTVTAIDSQRPRNVRLLLDVERIGDEAVTGWVTAYPPLNSPMAAALPGDRYSLSRARFHLIRGFHNLGGWDYEQYMERRGVAARMSVPSGSVITRAGEAPNWRRPFENFKRQAAALYAGVEPGVAAILKAALTGDQGLVSGGLRDIYSRAGTAHLLSVSGLHVGFVAGAVFFALKVIAFFALYPVRLRWASAGVPTIFAAVGALSASTLFALFTGPTVPAARSAIMAGVYLAAVAMGRGRDFYGAFALAMLIILALDPTALFQTGFQLSFGAVFFIAVFLDRWMGAPADQDVAPGAGPWWRRAVNRSPKVSGYLLVTVFATLGTAPLAAYHFNLIPSLGIIANALAVPVFSAAVPLGLLGLVAGNETLIILAAMLVDYATAISAWVASLPFAYRYIPSISAWTFCFYYAALGAALIYTGRPRAVIGLLAALAFLVTAAAPPLASRWEKKFTMRFLDVGQGDATLITWPGGAILVDAGARYDAFDVGRAVVAPAIWSAGYAALDGLFLTHADRDHVGGVMGVAERIAPALAVTGAGAGQPHDLARQAAGIRGTARDAAAGEVLSFPGNLTLEILNPPRGALPYPESTNNLSLVMRVVYGATSVLMTGDIDVKVERWLIASGANLRADVLKAAHHGAKSSNSPEFLEAVGARHAVISAGYGNRFHHPHRDVIRRLAKAGMAVWRTDQEGEIILASGGGEPKLTSYQREVIPLAPLPWR
ncbi:MAG: DNA internalization-related competence protein ComEC/Rec2 [Nitrospinae bacterium]|nr:DNA internalization-related competence protein ComEC/Rec2 [Nitrospinota bacterium]